MARTTHHHVAPELAVYALGAVDNAERAKIEAHLAACSDCRAETTKLRETAGLLAPLTRRDLDACWDRIAARVRAGKRAGSPGE